MERYSQIDSFEVFEMGIGIYDDVKNKVASAAGRLGSVTMKSLAVFGSLAVVTFAAVAIWLSQAAPLEGSITQAFNVTYVADNGQDLPSMNIGEHFSGDNVAVNLKLSNKGNTALPAVLFMACNDGEDLTCDSIQFLDVLGEQYPCTQVANGTTHMIENKTWAAQSATIFNTTMKVDQRYYGELDCVAYAN